MKFTTTLILATLLLFTCEHSTNPAGAEKVPHSEDIAPYVPISWAEINVRPETDCDVEYFIEGKRLLSYTLTLVGCQPGAPSNSCGVSLSTDIVSQSITVPDKPYTREDLLALVPKPWPEFRVVRWKDVTVKIKTPKPCQPVQDEPKKERPDTLLPAG